MTLTTCVQSGSVPVLITMDVTEAMACGLITSKSKPYCAALHNHVDFCYNNCYATFISAKLEEAFRKALEGGITKTCRGRMLLLGRAGVGKTSVKNALLGFDFSETHNITDMIHINHAMIDDDGTWNALDGMYSYCILQAKPACGTHFRIECHLLLVRWG